MLVWFQTKGPYKLKLFAYAGFQGKSMELTEVMMSTQEEWPSQKVMSCKILGGSWVFFEEPNYSGHYYVLDRGDYQYSSDWRLLCYNTINSFNANVDSACVKSNSTIEPYDVKRNEW